MLGRLWPALSFIIVVGLAFFWGILYSEMISADEEARIIYFATEGRGILMPENQSYKVCDLQSDTQGDIEWHCYVLSKDEYFERAKDYCNKKYTSEEIFNNLVSNQNKWTASVNKTPDSNNINPHIPFGGQ